MTAVVGLFAVGLVFLAVEVFLPNGLLALLSAVCLLLGVVTAFLQLGSIGGVLATALALLIGGGPCFILSLSFFPRAAWPNNFP